MSSSEYFAHWSPPTPLVDTLEGEHAPLVLTAAGFHQHDGQLVAYIGQYEYKPAYLVNGRRGPSTKGDKGHTGTTLRATTTADGRNWSPLIDLGVPVVPNHGPQRTHSGRLIISGNVMFPYTDDPTGVTGWRRTGIYPPTLSDDVYDDSEGFHLVQQRQGWPCGLCEGAFYQTDDGELHMLLRSNTDRLWLTHSDDDGRTWSPPEPSDFSDNGTKFHFGRLPDGRWYYVGCPDPRSVRPGRMRLIVSLSTEGARFDDHYLLEDQPYELKKPGLHKGGVYGYPHSVVHDEHLYVIYSLMKEAVAVSRVSLTSFDQ